ncbi:MAG: hypothetical protein QUU85_05890, partial [Candidatus Eisenbacteria bacterium]|nr:hypothetical protein [Candidatus Eisenbacteria bacterium]
QRQMCIRDSPRPDADRLPSADYRPPATDCRLPATRLPTADYRLRFTGSFSISSAVEITRAFAWNPR